jgi:hypothetical protein
LALPANALTCNFRYNRAMRVVLKIVAVVVIGTLLGLVLTWFSIFRPGWAGSVSNGPWQTSLDVGSKDAGIIQRARVAVHGLLALNRQETIYYTASTDSDGGALSGACVYHLTGRDPPARWWSITAYGSDDFLIPNAANRYSISVNTVARRADGGFTLILSKANGGANWIPVGDSRFSLSLRLYNPGASVAADPAHVPLPTITRGVCG